jgi:hypothetical protein
MIVCSLASKGVAKHQAVEVEKGNVLVRVVDSVGQFVSALDSAFNEFTRECKAKMRIKLYCVIVDNYIPDGVEELDEKKRLRN